MIGQDPVAPEGWVEVQEPSHLADHLVRPTAVIRRDEGHAQLPPITHLQEAYLESPSQLELKKDLGEAAETRSLEVIRGRGNDRRRHVIHPSDAAGEQSVDPPANVDEGEEGLGANGTDHPLSESLPL